MRVASTSETSASGCQTSGRSPSTTTPSTADDASRGDSRRNQAAAITIAGRSDVSSRLRNARLLRGERFDEIVAGTHDGHWNPCRLQAQELRLLRAADVDERRAAPRQRALHQPV